MAIAVALDGGLIEIGVGLGLRRCVDAVTANAGEEVAGGQRAALLHIHVTRIIRRGIGRAVLLGLVLLLDILLLLRDLNLDVLDPCCDLDVVARRLSA